MAFSKARRLANLMSTASDTVPASKVNTVLADDAVTTAKIADDAVTADQLANSINSAITANTAKVTNATHTGDVTGAAALTIATNAVNIAKLAVTDGSAGQVLSTDGSGAMSFITPATIQKLSSVPSVASEGTLYYNTTTDKLYLSNGTAWLPLDTNTPPVPTGGTVTIPTQLGFSTFSYNLGLNFADVESVDANLIYTLQSGTLPAGAVLPTAGNTTLTGTATNQANATYNFVIRASDAGGAFATQAYTQTITQVFDPTGGTITTAGGYRYHTFTSSGNFVANMSGAVQMLMVAGGGGGPSANTTGSGNRGGGGAGGMIASTPNLNGTVSIVIGAGGAAITGAYSGNSGSNTTATGQTTCIGGGGGGGFPDRVGLGRDGGSGGGSSYNPNRSNGTSGQGNGGGLCHISGSTYSGSGGGGGKGAVGGDGGSNHQGGDGGVGAAWLNGIYYAGGGGAGGGFPDGTNGQQGAGGNGGGGRGGPDTSLSPTTPVAGTVNTGGGGGAGGYTGNYGAAGGSGIVIIRYAV